MASCLTHNIEDILEKKRSFIFTVQRMGQLNMLLVVAMITLGTRAKDNRFGGNINNLDTATFSIDGGESIYFLFWAIAIKIIVTAVACYWIGCEYETTESTGRNQSFRKLVLYIWFF